MSTRRRLLGIDLGGTKIEGAVLDETENVVARQRIDTEAEGGYHHIVERIATVVDRLRPEVPDLDRIGMGTPGAISSVNRTLKNSNTQCLNGRHLREDLAKRIGLDVRMENDANCFALAEAISGAGRDHELVFGVIMGTGVGGGIVIRERLWPGPQHIGGEWGHHSIDRNGPPCYCGGRGCVEAMMAGPALERRYAEEVAAAAIRAPSAGPARAAADSHAGARASAREVARRAAGGDPIAARVMSDFYTVFGRALANLIAILDPSAVILGGGLSNIPDLYTTGRDEVARQIFNDELRTPILRNELGDSAGVIGAALLARDATLPTKR